MMRGSHLLALLVFFSFLLVGPALHATPDRYDNPVGYSGKGDDDAPSKSIQAPVRPDRLVLSRGSVRADHVEVPSRPTVGARSSMQGTSLLIQVRDEILSVVAFWKQQRN
jgi:hypothetical protein